MKPTLIIADDLEEIREKLYNVLLEDFEIEEKSRMRGSLRTVIRLCRKKQIDAC